MYNDKKYKPPRRTGKKRSFFSKPLDETGSGFLSNVEKVYKNLTNWEICLSAVLIIMGIVLYLYPNISMTIMSIFVGTIILLYTIIIFACFLKRNEIPLYNKYFIYIMCGIIIGIITMLNVVIFKQNIMIFMGIWFIYHAVIRLDLALKLKFMGENCWLFILISTVMNVFMGIILIINPLHQLLITEIVAAFLILFAVLNISNIFMLKNRSYYFLEQFE